jgi:Nif-specific regulatory protein
MGLGESASVAVDVRIVTASQTPLRELVAQNRLRRDLAARLNGLEVTLPTLAARRADIPPLFTQFLRQLCGGRPPAVEGRLIEALCLHSWPENVRELELLTRRLLAVHGHESLLRRHFLPPELVALSQDSGKSDGVSTPPRKRRDHDLTRLKQELQQNGGNVKAAAESLGISRQRIYRLLHGTDLAMTDGQRLAEKADGSGN